jgi:hypothetical protein
MKKKIILSAIITFSSIVMLAQAGYYSPVAQLQPNHSKAKELFLSLGTYTNISIASFLGETVQLSGIELNASYSITNRYYLFLSGYANPFSYKGTTLLGDKYNIDFNNYIGFVGVGYYKSNLTSFVSSYDFQLGAGSASTDVLRKAESDASLDRQTSGSYNNIFLQSTVSKQLKSFELSLSLRANYVIHNTFSSTFSSSGDQEVEDNIPSKLLFEPAIGGSYTFRGVKLNLQVGGFQTKYKETNQNMTIDARQRVFYSRVALQYTF